MTGNTLHEIYFEKKKKIIPVSNIPVSFIPPKERQTDQKYWYEKVKTQIQISPRTTLQ